MASSNPVLEYCDAYKASGLEPRRFAERMLTNDRELCLAVLEVIGSWPSSEPELRALQWTFR